MNYNRIKLSIGLMVLALSVACSNSAINQSADSTGVNESASQPGLNSIGIGVKYSTSQTSFSIWSPDTNNVKIWVNGTTYNCSPVTVNGYSNVYGITISGDLHMKDYYYLVNNNKVRDPYGVMYTNSTGNNTVINPALTDPDGGWVARPALVNREDTIVYEIHVRDFTIDTNSGVDPAKRGKFLGMVQTGTRNSNGQTTGIDHLKELGVTHVQILPFYDFGSGMYNWGYDPVNFNVPEEQYSMSQDPLQRIKEVKTMINEFHKNGIRVIMDVVYNHTLSNDMFSGITNQYFDGLNLSGTGNSVDSGKPMVSRFIQDSLNYWVSEYNIDGFRFDLIGVFYYTAVNQWGLSVNGNNPNANIVMYGEPWNGYATDPNEGQKVRMGKVPALSSGHVGVFNGNFRSVIKGDNDGTGRGYMFNVLPAWVDAIKSGVRGSIMAVKSTNPLPDMWDSMFAYDPEQSINYISAHDNYCLWDKIVHSGATGAYAQRVDKFGTAIILTSQGIPFLHGGDEMLRTKTYNGDWSKAANSYNASDNYNMIRWQWKTDNAAVNTYYKNLISMRKAHPSFRMTSWDQITANCTTTTANGGQVVINQMNGSAVGDSWTRVITIFNSGDNYTYTLPAGQWYIAVEKENAAAGGTAVSGSVVCEGTAVTVVYQGGTAYPPAAPTGVTVNGATANSLVVSWSASTGATSYTVYQSTSATGTFASIGTSNTTTLTATGLNASTGYYFKVTASNGAGTSGYSNVATGTTTAPVAGLKVHFKVNASANWGNVNCYYWASNGTPVTNAWPGSAMASEGGGWWLFSVPAATTTNIIFNNGTTQTVDLNRTGEGWFVPNGNTGGKITGTWYNSNPDVVTIPAVPVNVTAAAASTSSITVSWAASAGAASYTVYRSATSGGTYTSVGTAAAATFTATGLTAATTYYFKVTATNTAGTSAYSPVAYATTQSVPAGLRVHFQTNGIANWANVNCYYWASNGTPAANAWPGSAMTSEGSGWWVLTVPGATSSNVIFNNGGTQTVDLNRTGEGWFVPTGNTGGKISGTWYNAKP